ncbi:MAG: histidine--tRNA ligase [Desulfobacula sp.]|jgi:histidyl-tRNA synthetase|uniref:histidine--tRNA ligase n=1 Tax=Desulfobacula sp. TaxID=2593537 RepID=UPI001D3FC72D|nr:histidine--tRNA ligase [Desulfobacula sp.]MBT3483951.1 histidine--tRNA ligase [Desulfobacula sp.]MBT3803862.1 histidine--tRNA ligase [Desulfobacula sp.]MBT4023807.1 histidine--tRNA ligase [Desulfobacula sp.]MBT4197633.1 histidine--tRNA ligase [Desulfobacula sp.]
MQTIRGFRDILPEKISLWQKVEKEATHLFKSFGFKEIRIPIIEKTQLFARSIGEVTDIVEKEMYTFEDRKGDKLTLRPEATASIVRSYIQHKMYATDPIRKFYMVGPMFRRERPQKGRYRQFYQIDAEIFGVESAYVDSQLIFLLNQLFKRLGLTGLSAHINSLGCPECRPSFQKVLLDFIESKKDMLCENCLRRMDKNPLRILDCKIENCRNAIAHAPATLDHLCNECSDHFNTVKKALETQGVDFIVDKSLVRGLDYYTRTAWEIQTTTLGAQSAVAGGGRYDGLVKELGGPQTPAIGFAIGFDRLVEVMEQIDKIPEPLPLDLFIISLGDTAMEKGYHWSCELNQKGIRTEIDFRGKSLKALMKRADKLAARYVLIAGENELIENAIILRNMNTKEQVSLSMEDMIPELIKIFKK